LFRQPVCVQLSPTKAVKCHTCVLTADSLAKMPTAAEASAGSCLLDLLVAEAVDSVRSQDSDLLLSSSSDAGLSDQLNAVTLNGTDGAATKSDRISVARLSISDSVALATLNSIDQSQRASSADRLAADTAADLLSKIDDAFSGYIS